MGEPDYSIMSEDYSRVKGYEPDADLGSSLFNTAGDIERTFVWDGIGWKVEIVLERVMWAAEASRYRQAASTVPSADTMIAPSI